MFLRLWLFSNLSSKTAFRFAFDQWFSTVFLARTTRPLNSCGIKVLKLM